MRLEGRASALAVASVTAVAAATLALTDPESGLFWGTTATVVATGTLWLLIGGLLRSNAALREARAELAELAVAEERVRFARDMHDLLGHDLSLIAIKAELAGKLVARDSDRAAVEIGDIRTLSRTALVQVREAVDGYRRPTLPGELAGARVALDAAGIALEVEGPDAELDPEVEAVLAWAVREGATNVIRHSGARDATIAVTATGLEITDDGRGGRDDVERRRLRPRARGPRRAGGGGRRHGRGRLRARRRLPPARQRARPRKRGRGVIRVLLAEDQAMVRGALVSLLGLEDDIEVVAEVGRGDEVVAAARRERVDVALLDIGLPGVDGLEAAAALHAELPAVRVVMLTTFNRPGYLRRAMEAGAAGFLLKDAPATELARAIREAAAGRRVVDPGLAAAALSQGENPLTAREQEVLARAREHGTVAELAAALYLSPGTTRNHLSSIMQKLDVHSRIEAIRVAEDRGWL